MALFITLPEEPAVAADERIAELEARVARLEELVSRRPAGRPSTGKALTNAEKQRRYRERLRDRAAASQSL
jgi:hypothetical protein